jgi:hypothetical protein
VCFYCASIGIFEGPRLRRPTPAELATLQTSLVGFIQSVIVAHHHGRARLS